MEAADQGDRMDKVHGKKTRLHLLPKDTHHKLLNISPESPAPNKWGTTGRVKPLIRNRITSSSPEKKAGISDEHSTKSQLGPFTINTGQMSDSGIDQVFSDP